MAERPQGQERTFHSIAAVTGGRLRFDNIVQETPIQEIAAYDVTAGAEPAGERTLSYRIKVDAEPAKYPSVDELVRFVEGGYVADDLTIAGAGQEFGAAQLDGVAVRLLFEPRAQAVAEHVTDRFNQARDNVAFLGRKAMRLAGPA